MSWVLRAVLIIIFVNTNFKITSTYNKTGSNQTKYLKVNLPFGVLYHTKTLFVKTCSLN